jgi:hypothetical protein
MILNPSGMHGVFEGFFEVSPSLGAWIRYLVPEFYEAPYPETKSTYELTVMFMSLFVTDRCLNTIRVVQGKGNN